MFGIESGSQKILDRLKKEQTLAEIETAVNNAKAAGIKIVHGFFVVGIPDEPRRTCGPRFTRVEDPHLMARLQPTVCLSRYTAVARVRQARAPQRRPRLINFKCPSIDTTCLPGEEVHRIR